MKVLAVVSLTAFLCCYGVQSAKLSYRDLREHIRYSGTVVFIDFLDKVRNVTEKIVRDDQFRKSRITVQRLVKSLREFAKPVKNTENASGSQNKSDLFIKTRFPFMAAGTFASSFKEIFDKMFFPYLNIYRQSFKNETMVEIWKELESCYFPGAPPIYSKPMEFFSYLLAKAVVRSRLVNMLEAGVDIVLDIGKIDLNQIHEEVQIVLDHIRNKAFEISVLERQKEKNDFLISLRTASGLIVFYWDEVLKHTESPSFHAKYLDSMKQWAELIELRNASEKYHVLLDPDTRHGFLNWTKLHLDKFFDALQLEYYSRGNEALGLDRFNQSNWAIGKSAVVYTLPVYEKLSEVGFGITEINRFLNRVNHIILVLEGGDRSPTYRQTYLESGIRVFLDVPRFLIMLEETNYKDNPLLLPLCVIRRAFLEVWPSFLLMNIRNERCPHRRYDETELQQSVNEWNQEKSVIINELLKSKAFTRKQLEEAPKNFVQASHQIVKRLQQYTFLVDDFEKMIDPTAIAFERSMHCTNMWIHDVWDLLVE
ncbi:uncharacterized protein si:rp71-15k1.1 isoform X2 [Pimephales promelas]|uniref:uncharacterized protein si:rp71-15k1.1 isoform X2 n=1 Tax=Pimephales promelas TaxID=90988 RepID=UPI0019554F9A|nr:uncharacterized protein si:rp71-15k1.1 isoform X2 [Pimephales promelas]KAG1948653.1 hypothetical protein F2P79_012275 [Pimephales promelas]